MKNRISSVHQLEVLLLLQRYPEREWLASEVGRELYTHVTSAEDEMKRLCHLGLVSSSGKGTEEKFRYTPSDEATRQAVADLSEAYRQYRLKVIDAIFAPPQDVLKDFSDAFRFGRHKDD